MYIVIEMQTNADGTVGTITTPYADRNAAESAYHTALAAAAVSSLPKHSAALLTNEGYLEASQCYEHGESA